MTRMRFNQLEIDPAVNPAILDNASWDPGRAWQMVQEAGVDFWLSVQQAAANRTPFPASPMLTLYPASAASAQGVFYCLAGLPDGQQVIVAIEPSRVDVVLGQPLGLLPLPSGDFLACYPTDGATLDLHLRLIRPDKGPRPLGAIPRLGIGTRMTTAVWPGIWKALSTSHITANAIQNSVRELNLMDDLLAGRPAEKNIAFNFGEIETGYTGSTFEGLWVSGVLSALQSDLSFTYGADADHLQVKRGPDGLARARRLAAASRYYSFFTLDVSDVLDYHAYPVPSPAPDPGAAVGINGVDPGPVGAHPLSPSHQTALEAKYHLALDAVESLYQTLSELKAGTPFDLELSIDEHPPGVNTFDCLTTPAELRYVLLEMQRRGIPLTHIAPNLGVQKGVDYRGPDGLPGLEARSRVLSHLAQDFGVMLDVHSGDDLSAETRRALHRATSGRLHFKISPQLQLLFAEVLADYHPDLFLRWWEASRDYARREAAAGSTFAASCLRQAEEASPIPSAHDPVFHHFSFPFVGQRDPAGQFIRREAFYTLSPAFYAAYQGHVAAYLQQLSSDLFE